MAALSEVTFRPLAVGDGAALDQLLAAMSPENRYARFHTAVSRITASMRSHLLDLDGRRRAAWLAEVTQVAEPTGMTEAAEVTQVTGMTEATGTTEGGQAVDGSRSGSRRAIGIARYAAISPTCVELAVSVADDWHRHGVAAALIGRVLDSARAAGFRQVHADVLPDNAAALGLMRRIFPDAQTHRARAELLLTAQLDSLAPLRLLR